MSSGRFQVGTYEMDDGNIVKIKIQPETLAADLGSPNIFPVGAITIPNLSAKVSGSKRSIGVNARTVTVRFTSTLPDDYSGDDISGIPVLVKATFDAINKGVSTGTYLGQPVTIVGKSAEVVN